MILHCAIEVFAALLTPVIAAIAVYIAYQQWRTNRQRLDLDRYERRLRVYQAVDRFISNVVADVSPEPQDIFDLRKNTAEADFLFGSDVRDYLKTLATRAAELRKWNSKYRDYRETKPEEYDHSQVVAAQDREVRWFADQSERARQLFGKYLSAKR